VSTYSAQPHCFYVTLTNNIGRATPCFKEERSRAGNQDGAMTNTCPQFFLIARLHIKN